VVETKIKTKNLLSTILDINQFKSLLKIFINLNIEAVISELGYQRSEILFFKIEIMVSFTTIFLDLTITYLSLKVRLKALIRSVLNMNIK
jgi:hypothetical protein